MARRPHKSKKNRRRHRQRPAGGRVRLGRRRPGSDAQAELPPEFSYAYRKTGLLGLAEDKSAWPPESIKEWNDAVDEYRAIQAASARPDKPIGWNTQITELLISPFTQQDYDQVRECVSAIAPIEARGMKVVTRVELAAALLASACDHAYISGEEDAQGGGPNLFALTEELVLRRAREIYAQGHG